MSQAFLKKNIDQINNNIFYKNFFFLVRLIILLFVLNSIISNFLIELNNFKNYHKSSISDFNIIGKHHFTNDEKIKTQLIGLITSNNFITLNSQLIKKKIEIIPWIQKININKIWPNILKIKLVEYQPYAKWNDKFFIDKNGNIFLLPKNVTNNFTLLTFFGPKNSQYKILKMYNFIKKKFKIYNISIKSIKMNIRESWQLILSNNTQINIGKKNINERLELFIKVYPLLYKLKNKNIKYIDLRYNHGIAIKY